MSFFTIVIPVYNRLELLEEAVNSVLAQTFTGFKLLIVNDGSTVENAAARLDRYRADSRVSVIHQENKERGAARNAGFKQSDSDYVVFFDSDDKMHPDHLQALHEKIIEVNYPDFIASKYFIKNQKGLRGSDLQSMPEGVYDYHVLLNGNPFACNVCVKRGNPGLKLFVEDRKYSIMEDWLFLFQNLRTTTLFLIDKITLTMNDHEERSMQSNHDLMVEKKFLAYEWIKSTVDISQAEATMLEAHVNYFCAIHCYAAHERRKALQYLGKTIRLSGLKKKYAVLLLKIVAGRKLLAMIRN